MMPLVLVIDTILEVNQYVYIYLYILLSLRFHQGIDIGCL